MISGDYTVIIGGVFLGRQGKTNDYMDNTSIFDRTEIISCAQHELEERLNAFFDDFDNAGKGNNGVPTITQIEEILGKLNRETQNIFLKMLSNRINAIDESPLIESKKANT